MSTTTGVAARDRPIAAGQLPTKVAGRSYEPDMRPAVRPPRCGLRPTMSPPADLTEAPAGWQPAVGSRQSRRMSAS